MALVFQVLVSVHGDAIGLGLDASLDGEEGAATDDVVYQKISTGTKLGGSTVNCKKKKKIKVSLNTTLLLFY